MSSQKTKLNKRLVLIPLLVILCFSIGYVVRAQTELSFSTVIENGSQVETASYVIFVDGSTYYAKNGLTGEIQYSSTNASYVINIAISSSTNGGLIFLTSGTYLLTTEIRIHTANIELEGEGKSTIIKCADGTAINLINIVSAGENINNVRVANLYLDGNKANCPTGNIGIEVNCQWQDCGDSLIRIENVYIRYVKSHGIYVWSNVRELSMNNVYIYDCDGDGMFFDENCGDAKIISCIVGNCGLRGFNVKGQTIRFTGCKAFGCGKLHVSGATAGFSVENSRNGFVNCESQDNEGHGYLIYDTYENSFTGCVADSNGIDSGSGFWIDHSYNCTVESCSIFDRAPFNDDVHYQYYGIVLDNGADYNIIIGNMLFNNTHEAIIFGSSHKTHNIINHNDGFITENSGTQTIANGETVIHGLFSTPTTVIVSSRAVVYGSPEVPLIIGVTSRSSTTFTVSAFWVNGTAITNDAIAIDWYAEYEP